MDLGLIGKRGLVTGPSHGIGLSIAQTFQLEGCRVVANGRDAKKLAASVKDKVGYFGIPADMANQQQARKLIDGATELLGGIDILVCNVDSRASVKPGTEQLEDWQRSLSTNFLSATNAVGAAIAELKKTKGIIVYISSICGDEVIQGTPVP
jgi:NAD(P)-dependent dehydrogenase (short-subunit alcohol dehydrogenase family)